MTTLFATLRHTDLAWLSNGTVLTTLLSEGYKNSEKTAGLGGILALVNQHARDKDVAEQDLAKFPITNSHSYLRTLTMQKFMMIATAVAGISLLGMNETAEASHRCGGGFGGGYYSSGFYSGYAPSYRYNSGYRSNYYGPSYRSGYNRSFGGGHHHHGYYNRGYAQPGFSIRTRGFGLYIR